VGRRSTHGRRISAKEKKPRTGESLSTAENQKKLGLRGHCKKGGTMLAEKEFEKTLTGIV